MYSCHSTGGTQVFGFTKDHTIVTMQEHCVGINEKLLVVSTECVDSEQQSWRYANKVSNVTFGWKF